MFSVGESLRNKLNDCKRIRNLSVEFARRRIALIWLAKLGELLTSYAHHFKYRHCRNDSGISPIVVTEVIVTRVFAAKTCAGFCHDLFDVRMTHASSDRSAASLHDDFGDSLRTDQVMENNLSWML